MAALLPVITGLASAGTAVATMAKRTKSRSKRSAKRAETKTMVVYNPSKSGKMQTRRKPKPRRGGSQRAALVYRPTGLQSSAFIGRSSFSPAGPANRVADVSADGSLKIRGRSLLFSATAFRANGNVIAPVAGSRSAIGVSTASVSSVGYIGPAELDPRLSAIASIFSFYSIRKLQLNYVPTVSQYNYITATTGNSSLLSLGLSDDAGFVFAAPPSTNSQIADMPSACSGPAYQPMTLNYRHEGSRVWDTSTDNSGDTVNEEFQLIVAGLFLAPSVTGVIASNVGNFQAEWEIDFYRPIYLESNVSVHGGEQKLPDAKAPGDFKDTKDRPPPLSFRDIVKRRVDDPPSPAQSLLGAELQSAYAVPATARTAPVAIPRDERKTR